MKYILYPVMQIPPAFYPWWNGYSKRETVLSGHYTRIVPHPALTMTIENRRNARFLAALPIETIRLPISCRNDSSSGMQLSCPSINYRLLPERFKDGDLELTIELPNGEKLVAQARRVYASAYGDEYLIGVQLSRLSETHQRHFFVYLEQFASKPG